MSMRRDMGSVPYEGSGRAEPTNEKALPRGTEGLGSALSPIALKRASPSPAEPHAVGPGHSQGMGENRTHCDALPFKARAINAQGLSQVLGAASELSRQSEQLTAEVGRFLATVRVA
jgi:hypothetical protein